MSQKRVRRKETTGDHTAGATLNCYKIDRNKGHKNDTSKCTPENDRVRRNKTYEHNAPPSTFPPRRRYTTPYTKHVQEGNNGLVEKPRESPAVTNRTALRGTLFVATCPACLHCTSQSVNGQRLLRQRGCWPLGNCEVNSPGKIRSRFYGCSSDMRRTKTRLH